ncbi:MAG: dihydrolipoamide acetyltransferase family protein [Phycisphaeraceae bacterium]
MPITITMPRLSDTMEEGTILKWQVQVGDDVAAGDHLADVETDKATMELQAFDDGKVARLAVDEGKTVPVGEVICILAGEGESVEDAAKAEVGGGEQPAAATSGEATTEAAPEASESQAPAATAEPAAGGGQARPQGGGGGGRLRVSPLARKLAEERDVDLGGIDGSGPGGRIIKRDVLAAAEGKTRQGGGGSASPQAAPAAAPSTGAIQLEARTIELSSMRKTIARRLVESKATIPHFTVTVAIDMSPLMALRKTLNDQLESQGIKLSVNDFITRAAALACTRHPLVNASWSDGSIEVHGSVNVGIAVALPEERGGGLVVPVIRDVQNLGLRTISEQTRELAKQARGPGLKAEQMADGTITLSNLGMLGVEHFEAIINPPQAAILAIGAALEKPVVRDGEIVVGHEMTVTMSADHRVVDGAIAAEYLQTFKQMLENPASLLV